MKNLNNIQHQKNQQIIKKSHQSPKKHTKYFNISEMRIGYKNKRLVYSAHGILNAVLAHWLNLLALPSLIGCFWRKSSETAIALWCISDKQILTDIYQKINK